jgi:hypothetical protein
VRSCNLSKHGRSISRPSRSLSSRSAREMADDSCHQLLAIPPACYACFINPCRDGATPGRQHDGGSRRQTSPPSAT